MDLPPIVCASCGATYKHPGKAGTTHCARCKAEMIVAMPEPTAQAPVAPPRRTPAASVPRAPARPRVRPGTRVKPGHGHGHGHAHPSGKGSGSRNPLLLYGSLAGLVVVAVVLIFVLGSDGETDQQGRNATSRTATGSERNVKGDASTGESTGLPEPPPDLGGTEPPSQPSDRAETQKPSPEAGAATKTEGPSKAAAKTRRKLDRYRDLEPLPPVSGTPSQEVEEIKKLISEALDEEYPAQANRARFKLIDKGKPAVPLVINALLDLDLELLDREVITRGNILNEVLVSITGIRRQYDDRSENDEGILSRMRCRYFWHRWWKKSGKTWEPPKPEDG